MRPKIYTEEERKFRDNESRKRYLQSPKGKLALRRYASSPKAVACRRRYDLKKKIENGKKTQTTNTKSN